MALDPYRVCPICGGWPNNPEGHAEHADKKIAELTAPNGIVQAGETMLGYIKTHGETPHSTWLRAEELRIKLDELADKYAMLLLTTAPERVVKKVMERYK